MNSTSEIAGGFGPVKGKILRVGLMGTAARSVVLLFLSALGKVFARQGFRLASGAGSWCGDFGTTASGNRGAVGR